jgi:hypothetical protein
MKIVEHENFLFIKDSVDPGKYSVKILSSQHDAIEQWTSCTRISPIYRIEGYANSSITSFNFPGQKYILFLGPVHPERILHCCNTKHKVWITMGLFNLVIVPPNKRQLNKLVETARNGKVPVEYGMLKDGIIEDVYFEGAKGSSPFSLRPATELSKTSFPDELGETIREYCPLIASTLSRSKSLPADMAVELENISNFLADIFTDFSRPPTVEVTYRHLSELLTINAALSRFSSQTFAGTSPILNTECHFWSNSLLGIGVATLLLGISGPISIRLWEKQDCPNVLQALEKEQRTFPI